MCARPAFVRARTACVLGAVFLAACSSPERTGTAFCRQLAAELPAIAAPIATGKDVTATVERWERLLDRSPLAIEDDVATVTELFRSASRVDPTNADSVQALADLAYASNKSAIAVRDWVMDTCAVDVSTGLSVEPARTVPPATTTTTVAGAPPASEAPQDSVATTVAP